MYKHSSEGNFGSLIFLNADAFQEPFNPYKDRYSFSEYFFFLSHSAYLDQFNFFYLHSGGWNQGPLDTAAT
jgi:hypothetical protein